MSGTLPDVIDDSNLICLTMIVKDEAASIEECLEKAKPLIDRWVICDTGSTDGTQELIREALKDVPGELHEVPWRSFGENRSEVIALAGDSAEWLLRLDADWFIEAHPLMRSWLIEDVDPEVAAWQVEIEEAGTVWRLPILTRARAQQHYVGATHEYLVIEGKQRPLVGVVIRHRPDGSRLAAKYERDLELLTGDDDRSVFYRAETLRFLGRTEEAIEEYERRASMNGWDEERWYATYQAAKLAGDARALLAVWRSRPWRHEPLTEAARIVAAEGSKDDVLFLETR